MNIISNSLQETKQFAKEFVKKLKGGEVLGLVGELGAGKTVFTQGLAEALGVEEIVNSPTFVLMKMYKTKNSKLKTLIHMDAYRLESFNQLKEIGAEEYINKKDCLVVIEWADRVPEVRKYPKYQEIVFLEGENENQRAIKTE